MLIRHPFQELASAHVCHLFLLGRCVKAEPAAVLAALLEFGFLKTLDAADAAFLLVTSLFCFLGILFSFKL